MILSEEAAGDGGKKDLPLNRKKTIAEEAQVPQKKEKKGKDQM